MTAISGLNVYCSSFVALLIFLLSASICFVAVASASVELLLVWLVAGRCRYEVGNSKDEGCSPIYCVGLLPVNTLALDLLLVRPAFYCSTLG